MYFVFIITNLFRHHGVATSISGYLGILSRSIRR